MPRSKERQQQYNAERREKYQQQKQKNVAKAENTTKATKGGRGRTRNFATVVYPESASSDWLEKLSEHFVPAFISPLHEHDKNPTGSIKKAHFHVLLMFEGVKTDEQVKSILDTIGGVGLERVNSLRGYARYLCHLDNPEKHQYDVQDVMCLCGADYMAIIGLASDKYKAISEMIHFCKDNSVVSYAELLEYTEIHRRDWFRVLCDNGTYVIKEYLKSKEWTERQNLEAVLIAENTANRTNEVENET